MRLVAVQSGGSTVADLVNEALGAFERRDRDRAAALLSEAVKSEADLGAKWGAVSRLASTVGAISAALTAAERHVRADPDNPVPRLAFGEMLAHHGRVAAACAIGTALTRDHPSNPAAWHFLGTCLAQTGEHEASMSALRQAMALHTHPSGLAWSWQALAEMKTFSEHDSDLGAMNDLLHRFPTTTLSESRSVLMYGIGKAHDDIGNVDEAFAAYAEGARLSRQLHPYDRKQTQSFVDQIVGGWTSQFATSLPCSGIESTRPVFVFGLPRSGTTLVEQILVGHDDVSDGAEINLFSTAAMPIKGFTPRDVEAFAKTHGADGFAAVGESYLDMLNDRFGKDGRIIDKTLNHSRYLGLIHHVLPNARFIWLSRSPGAVAWSCFRTRFARGVDWSWSMEDMAHYFAGEDRLREHWCAQLGEAILTVPYEALVGDIELWIGKILAHVGLRPQAGLGDFHLTKRAVTTASFAQVRKPLYTSSREAWRRYEAHLAPFFKAYQD